MGCKRPQNLLWERSKGSSIRRSSHARRNVEESYFIQSKEIPDLAKERRNTVLALAEQKGVISSKQLEAYKKLPLDVSLFKRETHLDGIAPHFRIELGSG